MDNRTAPTSVYPAPPAIALLDRTGRVRRLNERMALALGITGAEGLGRPFPALLRSGSARSAARELISAAITTAGSPVHTTLELPGPATIPVALPVEASTTPGAAGRQLVRLAEYDPGGDTAQPLSTLRSALSLTGTGLWSYSSKDRLLTWLGGDAPLPALGGAGPFQVEELLARLDQDDAAMVTRTLLTGARSAEPPWVRVRIRADDGRRHCLSTRCTRMRLGLEGPEVLIGVVRDDTPQLDGRAQLLGRLQDERERAARIADVSASLISATTEEEFSRIVLDEVAGAFGGTGMLLAMVANGRLLPCPGRGVSPWFAGSMLGLPLDADRPLPYAIRTGEPQFISTRAELVELWPASREVLDHSGAASFAVIPFGAGNRPMGGWVVSHDTEYHPGTDERTLIQTLAHLAGQALERIRLQQARLELARVLQQGMLPPLLDPLPGLEIAARYAPASGGLDIGGDWYDAFPLADGTVALIIGDVQGHDVDAAAFMGQVRTSIRAFASLEGDPGTVLARTNDLLVGMAVPIFASCTFLHYNPATATVRAARAGHVPLIRANQDGSHGLQEIDGGPVLGVLPRARYPTLTFPLHPGDLLALVTDGVVEGPALSLEDGLARVGALAARALQEGLGPDRVADRLLASAAAVGHTDDAALLLVRRAASGTL